MDIFSPASKTLFAVSVVALLLQSCGGSHSSGSTSSPVANNGTGTNTTPGSGTSPLSISVSGASLVDGNGKTVQLRGVNISGLEFVAIGGWTNDPWGGQTGTPVPQWSTIASWGANAVRLPLNEASWLGYTCTNTDGSTHNPDPGGNYKATVLDSVTAAQAAGLYVILDLHWTAPGTYCPRNQDKMADADNATTFWTSVATAYKGNPGVLFEMFNEPMVYDQTTLLSGASWTQTLSPGGGAPTTYNWTSAGMNALIAAVRATGAKNVVLVGGQNYDSDLSQWLTQKPVDKLNQYAAVWHAYPAYGAVFGTAAWNLPNYGQAAYDSAKAIVNAGIPVVITEFGYHNATGTTNAPFASNLLPWADTNGISYLGWSWDKWSGPDFILIQDAAGTPTDGYGTYVKQHYQCRAAGTASCL